MINCMAFFAGQDLPQGNSLTLLGSINQFISAAVSEKISAILTEELLEARARRAEKDSLRKILDRVADRPPQEGDEA